MGNSLGDFIEALSDQKEPNVSREDTMLTPQQLAHFSTFGFLLLPRAFTAEEMTALMRAAEAVWKEDPAPEENAERRLNYFVERQPLLTRLVADERIYPVIEALMGSEFIWVGSEGNISNRSEVRWHPDRKYYRSGEEQRIDYPQVKVMIYLEKVGRDTGCLRVIPGSHRMPYHKDLADQEISPDALPFGLAGRDIPCAALESEPGDVILFNHCIWHASFGGGRGRRYIALKFAAKPFAADHLISLERYTGKVFQPHEAFLNSDEPRIRALVENLPRYATGCIGD